MIPTPPRATGCNIAVRIAAVVQPCCCEYCCVTECQHYQVAFGLFEDTEAKSDRSKSAASLQELVHKMKLQTPYGLIGKRLLVKWAKAKFYGGIVTSYDPTTRKHTILYDDGDEKSYKLEEKTIEGVSSSNSR